MRYCSNCRAQLRDNENFCQNCGSQANNQNSIFNEENTVVSPRGAADFDAPTDELQKWQIPLLIIGVLVIEVVFFSVAFAVASNSNTTGATSTYTGNANRTASSFSTTYNAHSRNATNMSSTSVSTSTEVGRAGTLLTNVNLRSCADKSCVSMGEHFKNARFRILDVINKEGIDWYRVEIISYGCHALNSNWCGKKLLREKNREEVNRSYELSGDESAADTGWINSYNKDFQIYTVQLD